MKNNSFLSKCSGVGLTVKNHIKYAVNCLSVMLGMALVTGGPVTAWAAGDDENDFGFLKEKGNGAFDDLKDTVQQTGASGMNLMTAIGIVGIVVAIMLAALTVMLKKGGKREEGKDSLEWAAIGGIIFFGAIGIGSMIAGVGSSIGGK